MDYEKPWNPSSNLQFPIAIRNIVYQTFRFRPLKKLGHTYYQMTAKKIGKVLQSIASSSKVFLTGAEEELFIPGISELNFLIVKDREIREREIWDLRTEYFDISYFKIQHYEKVFVRYKPNCFCRFLFFLSCCIILSYIILCFSYILFSYLILPNCLEGCLWCHRTVTLPVPALSAE